MPTTPSTHPDWAAVGNTVRVRTTYISGRLDGERTATVARHTPSLIVLDTGEKFRRSPWSPTYAIRPKGDLYDVELLPDTKD